MAGIAKGAKLLEGGTFLMLEIYVFFMKNLDNQARVLLVDIN
jgi:hypothetical protein